MKLLEVGSKTYLVTANGGRIREYTVDQHGFVWTEAILAGSLGSLQVNISNATLLGQMGQNASLGR